MAEQLIISAGLMALNMAFTATRKIEGPRTTDLKFSGGDAGTPLNYFYGTRRFAGLPYIYAEEIREKKRKRKTKGGKYNDYTYFLTFAVVIADHEIDAVTRIWFDKHQVYDATGVGPLSVSVPGDTADDPLLSLSQYLRIYLGTDTQEPDPRMLAKIEAKFGVGSCPAYRRIAYIMVEEMPGEKLGNRFPQVSVEATDGATSTYPWEEIADASSANYNYGYYGTRLVNVINNTLYVIDRPSRTLIINVTLPADADEGGIGIAADGQIYAVCGVFFLPELWLFGPEGGGALLTSDFDAFPEGCSFAGGLCCVYPYAMLGADIMYFNGTKVEVVSNAFVPRLYFTDTDGTAWASGDAGSGDIGLFQMPGGPPIVVPASTSGGGAWAMDNGNGQFFVISGGDMLLVDKDTMTVVDTASAPSHNDNDLNLAFRNVAPGASSIWIKYAEVSTTTLEVLRTVSPGNWSGAPTLSYVFFEPINHALVGLPSVAPNLHLLYLDRLTGGGVTLGTITSDICQRCGIDPADFDVTALTDTIDGYSWTQGQGTQILEPLMDLYAAFPRPHDFDVQFVKRGASSAGTIDVSEFAKNTPRYKVDPKLDNDLPSVVSLTFADPDADQQPNQVDSPRRRGTTEGKGEASYDMGTLVLNVDDAYNLVTRYHRGVWNRNEAIENGVTSDYTKLEPGDVWNLALDDETRTALLTKLTFSSSGELKCEWEKDFAQLATLPDLTGAPKDGHEPGVILAPTESKALILDIPLVRDSDNQDNPLLYEGAAPFAPGVWPGAVIYEDDGTGTYPIELAGVDSAHAATWGVTTDALPDASYLVWDRGNSFNVQMRNGDVPVSVTEAACNANPRLNMFALGADGRWELGQFTTATLEIDGTVTYSGLKRGRRGSEWATGLHVAGETFVLMDNIGYVELGAGDIGNTLSFKAGTSGLDPDGAIPVSIGYDGQSNMPWAPAQFRATKDYTTGDWVFTWRRRSRVAGDWAPGTPPLGESVESYKLRIYDSDDVVVRTLTVSSESTTWTAAQQVTDFGGERWSHVVAGVVQVGDLAEGFETLTTFTATAPPSNLVFVGGAKGNGASSSPITVSLTSLTGGIDTAPSADDIVIIAWAPAPNVTPDLDVAVTGYTQIDEAYAPGAGLDTNLGVFWKKMGVSPDTTAELSATGGASFQGSYAIQVWRGQHATVPIGVYEQAIGTDQDPNPPEIEPAVERSVMIFAGANSNSNASEAVAAPTQNTADLDNFIAQGATAGGSDHTAIGMGSKFWDGTGPYDAPAWDGKGSGSTWAAIAFELRSS